MRNPFSTESLERAQKANTAGSVLILGAHALGMMIGCVGILCVLVLMFVPFLIRDTLRVIIGSPAAVVLLVCLTAPSAAFAQGVDPLADVRLVRLSEGQRAPAAGILAPESLFVDWRARIVILEDRLEIEDAAASERELALDELHQARLAFEGERRVLERGLFEDRISALLNELESARAAAKLGFFEQPAFWFAMGVFVTGAGVAVAAIAAR